MTSVASNNLSAVTTGNFPAVALTVAGSEAAGGAGAQSDLKTFQEPGVFGIANLTCIVSFNPKGNWNLRFVPVDQQVIADHLEATTAAYGAASGAPSVLGTVKIGTLGSPATISTVHLTGPTPSTSTTTARRWKSSPKRRWVRWRRSVRCPVGGRTALGRQTVSAGPILCP